MSLFIYTFLKKLSRIRIKDPNINKATKYLANTRSMTMKNNQTDNKKVKIIKKYFINKL